MQFPWLVKRASSVNNIKEKIVSFIYFSYKAHWQNAMWFIKCVDEIYAVQRFVSTLFLLISYVQSSRINLRVMNYNCKNTSFISSITTAFTKTQVSLFFFNFVHNVQTLNRWHKIMPFSREKFGWFLCIFRNISAWLECQCDPEA